MTTTDRRNPPSPRALWFNRTWPNLANEVNLVPIWPTYGIGVALRTEEWSQ
jgi:hypothetical protein